MTCPNPACGRRVLTHGPVCLYCGTKLTPSTDTPASAASVADHLLGKLQRLRDSGELTEQEHERIKAALQRDYSPELVGSSRWRQRADVSGTRQKEGDPWRLVGAIIGATFIL